MTLPASRSGGARVGVAIVGLGAIGREVLKAVEARPGLTLVAVAILNMAKSIHYWRSVAVGGACS